MKKNKKINKITAIIPAMLAVFLAAAVLSGCSVQEIVDAVDNYVYENVSESADEKLQIETKTPSEEYLHFKNSERLQEHFEKHNEDFGYGSAEAYEAGANAVIQNPDSLCKLEKEDGDYVYYLETTEEFVVVSPQGVIRTYYKADRDYFDRQ